MLGESPDFYLVEKYMQGPTELPKLLEGPLLVGPWVEGLMVYCTKLQEQRAQMLEEEFIEKDIPYHIKQLYPQLQSKPDEVL